MAGEALSWFLTSKRCYRSREISPGRFESFYYQAVVCNAFAIELYIKAMIITRGKLPLGGHHNCYEYFKDLPADLKAAISKTYAAAIPYSDNVLKDYLRDNGDRFVTFRYVYEEVARLHPGGGTILGGTNFGVYWIVSEVLHNSLLDLDPRFGASGLKRFKTIR